MEPRSEIVKVKLADGSIILVEAAALGGEEDISFNVPDLSQAMHAIEGIATSLSGVLARVKPQKASIEFGIELAIESGQLTTLLVKGSGKSNLKVTLEFSEPQAAKS